MEANKEVHSDQNRKVEIPNDDIIVQILARLDGQGYNQALYQDANTINEKFLGKQKLFVHNGHNPPFDLGIMCSDCETTDEGAHRRHTHLAVD